jgi:hypothetical protein
MVCRALRQGFLWLLLQALLTNTLRLSRYLREQFGWKFDLHAPTLCDLWRARQAQISLLAAWANECRHGQSFC